MRYYREIGLRRHKKCRRNRCSWQITAWRSLATICRNAYPHTQIRHGAALPPVATMQGGRCTTSPRLIFFGGLTFSTELFKPNGMKEKENIESWQITAYRRFAKLGRKHCARIIKRIPLGLQPVETIHCGRYATPSRLIFYEAIRLLPNYSNLTA